MVSVAVGYVAVGLGPWLLVTFGGVFDSCVFTTGSGVEAGEALTPERMMAKVRPTRGVLPSILGSLFPFGLLGQEQLLGWY
jgi:hypothetical protein